MADEVRPGVRVGDAERDSTAALLRRHATDGRLTLDELDERLRDAYAAKTVGELNVLLDDLPAIRTDVELIQPSSAPARRMEHSVDPAAARGGNQPPHVGQLGVGQRGGLRDLAAEQHHGRW